MKHSDREINVENYLQLITQLSSTLSLKILETYLSGKLKCMESAFCTATNPKKKPQQYPETELHQINLHSQVAGL